MTVLALLSPRCLSMHKKQRQLVRPPSLSVRDCSPTDRSSAWRLQQGAPTHWGDHRCHVSITHSRSNLRSSFASAFASPMRRDMAQTQTCTSSYCCIPIAGQRVTSRSPLSSLAASLQEDGTPFHLDWAEAENLALAVGNAIMEEPLATWSFLPPPSLPQVYNGAYR